MLWEPVAIRDVFGEIKLISTRISSEMRQTQQWFYSLSFHTALADKKWCMQSEVCAAVNYINSSLNLSACMLCEMMRQTPKTPDTHKLPNTPLASNLSASAGQQFAEWFRFVPQNTTVSTFLSIYMGIKSKWYKACACHGEKVTEEYCNWPALVSHCNCCSCLFVYSLEWTGIGNYYLLVNIMVIAIDLYLAASTLKMYVLAHVLFEFLTPPSDIAEHHKVLILHSCLNAIVPSDTLYIISDWPYV